ncbi:mitochondrial import receptor subunit TOM70 [Condylostylus longicornis]|uniref:mitochondrial import receptor subunit TOM70 n=1 Tax=Condylostylus longicornis TaxID=2530218 RepID=UPI00244E2207|nr:mitochondrial import receptor subunit TOM70 [Condylostylus longicornis]
MSVQMMSTLNAGSTIPKWQMALLLGTPVAIGLGYYMYKKKSNKIDGSVDSKKKYFDLKSASLSSIDGSENEKDIDRKKKLAELEGEKLTPLKEAQIHKNDGNVCYRQGKFDEAIKFYDKAIEKCPKENKTDLAIFYQNRAAAYEMLKKWNQVKADCTKSLEYNPRYTKAYFRRAKAYEATNDLLDCLDDVTATCILEIFQNNTTIMFADRILKQTGSDDAISGMKNRVPVFPSKHFTKTYFRSFVSDTLRNMKLENIEDSKGFIKARLAWDDDRFDDVISACTEEIELSEGESQYKVEATLLRGTFNLLRGCFEEAKQDLDLVINNADADVKLRVNAYLKRASLYVQTEKRDLVFKDFDEAEKLDPNNADVYYQRAQIYLLLDQVDKALVEFDKVCKLAPEHGMAFVQKVYAEYRLAFMSQDQMRLLSVMNEFKNAIDKFPNCVECYSLMAQVLTDQGQYDSADSFFEKAIKMAPENAALYVHRGIMHLQWNGDIEKALSLIKKSIEIDEKCELAYETLGTIEVQRGNLERAIELFEEAIKLAKGQTEMAHLYALRNAARAQINVTRKLGIDMSAITSLVQAGITPPQ